MDEYIKLIGFTLEDAKLYWCETDYNLCVIGENDKPLQSGNNHIPIINNIVTQVIMIR
jgi:hypothetical protein